MKKNFIKIYWVGMTLEITDGEMWEHIIPQRIVNVMGEWKKLVQSDIFVYKIVGNENKRILFFKIRGRKENFNPEIIKYYKNTRWGVFSKKNNAFITKKAEKYILEKEKKEYILLDDEIKKVNLERFENMYVDLYKDKLTTIPITFLYSIRTSSVRDMIKDFINQIITLRKQQK